jgi:hypothetical protein
MADYAETPTNALLHADSDNALTDSDDDVSAALSTYCAIFKKWKSLANIEACLDLLSCCIPMSTTSRLPCPLLLVTSSAAWPSLSASTSPRMERPLAIFSVFALAQDPGQCRAWLDPAQAQDPLTHSGRPKSKFPELFPRLPWQIKTCRTVLAVRPSARRPNNLWSSPTQASPTPTPRPPLRTTSIPMWGLLPRRMLSALLSSSHLK